MDQSLSKLGVQSGNQFDCDDFVQHLQFKVIVHHSTEKHLDEFEIISNSTAKNDTQSLTNGNNQSSNNTAVDTPTKSIDAVTGNKNFYFYNY